MGLWKWWGDASEPGGSSQAKINRKKKNPNS